MSYNQFTNETGVIVQQQQPTIVAPHSTTQIFQVNTVRNLGITHVIFGFLLMICGFVGVADGSWSWFASTGTGIWSGIIILITGSICIVAAKNPQQYGTKCAALTFSIISIFLAFIAGIIGYIGFMSMVSCSSLCSYDNYNNYNCVTTCLKRPASAISSILVSVIMTVEFIISIITSVYTGRGCCGESHSGVVIVQQPYYPQTGTVITSNVSTHGNQVPYNAPPYSAPSYPQSTAGYPQSTGYQPQYQYTQAPMATQAPATGQAGVTYGTDYKQAQNMASEPNKDQAPPAYVY